MTFTETISAAIADIERHGYDSQARVDRWVEAIRQAAIAHMASAQQLEEALRGTLAGIYRRLVDHEGIFKLHPGFVKAEPEVARFKLAQIKPQLRAELDRRIMASANLIRLNRAAMLEKTNQRFQGWATSIPAGGSDAVDKQEVKANLRKALAQLPFEERRVHIDQGHKLIGAINNIVASDGGAIALRWRSHWRQAGYNYREDHKERDKQIYLIRGSWAQTQGLIKPGSAPYYDEVTAVGEEVYCRCWAVYLYSLSELPSDLLTAKGKVAA